MKKPLFFLFAEKEQEYLNSMYWQIIKNSKTNKMTKQCFKEFTGISEHLAYKIFQIFEDGNKNYLSISEFIQAINLFFSSLKILDKNNSYRTLEEKIISLFFNKNTNKAGKIAFIEIRNFFNYVVFDIFNKFNIYDFEQFTKSIKSINDFNCHIFGIDSESFIEEEMTQAEFIEIIKNNKSFTNLIILLLNILNPINEILIKNLTLSESKILENDDLLIQDDFSNYEDLLENKKTLRINGLPASPSKKKINALKDKSIFEELLKSNSKEEFNNNMYNGNEKIKIPGFPFSKSKDIIKENLDEHDLEILKENVETLEKKITHKEIRTKSFLDNSKYLECEINKTTSFINKIIPQKKNNKQSLNHDYKDSKFKIAEKSEEKGSDYNKSNDSNNFIPEEAKSLESEDNYYYFEKTKLLQSFENHQEIKAIIGNLLEMYKKMKKQNKIYFKSQKVLFFESHNHADLNTLNHSNTHFNFDSLNSCFKSENLNLVDPIILHLCDIEIYQDHIILTKTIHKKKENDQIQDLKYCYSFKLRNNFFFESLFQISSGNCKAKINVNGLNNDYYVLNIYNYDQNYKLFFDNFSDYEKIQNILQAYISCKFNYFSLTTIQNYYLKIFSKINHEKQKKNKIIYTFNFYSEEHNNSFNNKTNNTTKVQVFLKSKIKEEHNEFFHKILDLLQLNNYLEFPIFPIRNYYENKDFILLEFIPNDFFTIEYDNKLEIFCINLKSDLIQGIRMEKFDIEIQKFLKIISVLNENLFFKDLINLCSLIAKVIK